MRDSSATLITSELSHMVTELACYLKNASVFLYSLRDTN